MDKIATTIKRQWLREIVAGRKKVEYHEIKPYWVNRLAGVTTPFALRLINGMQAKAPEVTVVARKVRQNTKSGVFELHLGAVTAVRNWNRRRETPRTS